MSRVSGVVRNLREIVEILSKTQYAKLTLKSEKNINDLTLLPLGQKLLDNLKREWINSDPVINIYHRSEENARETQKVRKICEENPLSLYTSKDFEEKFRNLKENYQAEIPLGVSECLSCPSFERKAENPGESLNFSLKNIQYLTCSYFISPVSAIEQFYRIQRQRKIWWMKYSSNPGRFKVSESKTIEQSEGKIQRISIRSNINESSLDLETIELISLNSGGNLKLRDQRSGQEITPAIVKTGICLEIATLGVLVDAIDSSDETESLMLHRKIAPHQLAVLCYSQQPDNLSDLQDLAQLVTINTRKVGISTLNLPKGATDEEKHLSQELSVMDRLGVPYCIILNDESLRNGILQLRSRDTSLSEAVHLTDIPKYLIKIYSSF
ncbi:DNA polymerase subunit gamma-2, mitochondrial [Lutzomyia longipalpis]|uniref:DNA polymerase subunit gamma-2, mitochondrial n=1 Tax=Lutzomyia longipalpis TaxID=7200 RepID=UPI0024845B78|nr:DNA polymerase subunit gamma-2, mitochondrial [Lutzomyia longipalpis]